jgi:hypothetical protein
MIVKMGVLAQRNININAYAISEALGEVKIMKIIFGMDIFRRGINERK